MSNRKPGVFIGGDVRRVGFAAEAMRDGITATESIDRYLRGENVTQGRETEYEKLPMPRYPLTNHSRKLFGRRQSSV